MPTICTFSIDASILHSVLTKMKPHNLYLFLNTDNIDFQINYPNTLISLYRDVLIDYKLETSPMIFILPYSRYFIMLPQKKGNIINVTIVSNGSDVKFVMNSNTNLNYTSTLKLPSEHTRTDKLSIIESPTTTITIRDIKTFNTMLQTHRYGLHLHTISGELHIGGYSEYATLPLEKSGEDIRCEVGVGPELKKIKIKESPVVYKLSTSTSKSQLIFIEDKVVYIIETSLYVET